MEFFLHDDELRCSVEDALSFWLSKMYAIQIQAFRLSFASSYFFDR